MQGAFSAHLTSTRRFDKAKSPLRSRGKGLALHLILTKTEPVSKHSTLTGYDNSRSLE